MNAFDENQRALNAFAIAHNNCMEYCLNKDSVDYQLWNRVRIALGRVCKQTALAANAAHAAKHGPTMPLRVYAERKRAGLIHKPTHL